MRHIIYILILLGINSAPLWSQINEDKQLASQYFQNQEYDKAVVIYQKLYSQSKLPFYYNFYLECLLKTGNYKQAEKIVNICFDTMIQSLYDDERIEIRGFGSFANRNYKAYEGRNPKTGKVVKVPPKKVPFFKVGKELKEIVDAGKDKYVIREA